MVPTELEKVGASYGCHKTLTSFFRKSMRLITKMVVDVETKALYRVLARDCVLQKPPSQQNELEAIAKDCVTSMRVKKAAQYRNEERS